MTRKTVGLLLTGAALFIFAFWCYRFGAGVAEAFTEKEGGGAGGALAFMGPLLRFLAWTTAALVLFVMGRRLSAPDRRARQAESLARKALAGEDGREEEGVRVDEVSRLYEGLPLEDLVLVERAVDGGRYPERRRRLMAEMKKRLLFTGGSEAGGKA